MHLRTFARRLHKILFPKCSTYVGEMLQKPADMMTTRNGLHFLKLMQRFTKSFEFRCLSTYSSAIETKTLSHVFLLPIKKIRYFGSFEITKRTRPRQNWTTITTRLITLSRLCRLLLVRMDVYIVTLSDFHSYRLIGKLTAFFAVSGVQSTESNLGATCFHFRRAAVQNQIKS
jgi:hypothetical protein